MAGLVKQEVEYDSDEELFPKKVAAPEDEVEAEPEEDTTLGECPASSFVSFPLPVFISHC